MSIEELTRRVEELEARLGLPVAGLTPSARILAIFAALEPAGGGPVTPPPASFEGQLARLKDFVDDEPSGEIAPGTIEGVLAGIGKKLAGEPATEGMSGEEIADFEGFQQKVQGTNINPATLLATDYLNHFNEIVMTLEMVPMMPEILEEAREWQPKSYQEHFRDSTFSDRDLAVEAYEHVPARFRDPFEVTIGQLDRLVASTIERLDKDLAAGQPEMVQITAAGASEMIRRLIDVASGIIHGSEKAMDQSEIDHFIS